MFVFSPGGTCVLLPVLRNMCANMLRHASTTSLPIRIPALKSETQHKTRRYKVTHDNINEVSFAGLTGISCPHMINYEWDSWITVHWCSTVTVFFLCMIGPYLKLRQGVCAAFQAFNCSLLRCHSYKLLDIPVRPIG